MHLPYAQNSFELPCFPVFQGLTKYSNGQGSETFYDAETQEFQDFRPSSTQSEQFEIEPGLGSQCFDQTFQHDCYEILRNRHGLYHGVKKVETQTQHSDP